MRPKLVLFDIDGTILKVSDGLSKNIFQKVFCNLFNLEQTATNIDFDFSGLTDLEILYKLSKIYEIDFQKVESNIEIIWKRIYSEFETRCKKEDIHVYDNVKEFITELDSKANVTIGLLTGNFKECAYLKLGLVGLDKFFAFGAFGNESIERSNLPPLAIERANRFVGKDIFTNDNTYIIGDSVLDIIAARKNNIKVISVATGRTEYEELVKMEPDLAIHNFSEKDRINTFLGL
ncbi:MAG: hypothetical protein CH6_4447 [Candidatus Kapaibacterium sp.]|nr:MAG: hypothetical protein CH6_4447 [Candidatus Kapabacteria bacterium]